MAGLDILPGSLDLLMPSGGSRPWNERAGQSIEAGRRDRRFGGREVLAVYPVTATEMELDFSGSYDPPLGRPLGDALDAVALYRPGEASMHRFVTDVAHHLR